MKFDRGWTSVATEKGKPLLQEMTDTEMKAAATAVLTGLSRLQRAALLAGASVGMDL